MGVIGWYFIYAMRMTKNEIYSTANMTQPPVMKGITQYPNFYIEKLSFFLSNLGIVLRITFKLFKLFFRAIDDVGR